MTERFERKFSRVIPENLKEHALKKIRRLSENPHLGKPLKFNFVRELKAGKFRIYFIVFEKEVLVLMVNVSDKKDQQETINAIYSGLPGFFAYIKNLKGKTL